MATKKKMLQAAAGNAAGGAALDITDVFSTFIHDGGSAQNIVNGIDLSTEGGLVWFKARSNAFDHALFDSENSSFGSYLSSNLTSASSSLSGHVTANSNGFSLDSTGYGITNGNAINYASWTFRKAPKFFDVVTWTGDGSNNKAIPHGLGSVPGMIWIKNLSNSSTGWLVWHRSQGNSNYAVLNITQSFNNGSLYWPTAHTDTDFYVSNGYNDSSSNGSGANYVAYVFAHNNGDGTFGPDGDQDVIKCGSYTGNNGYNKITLGFEPQWILIKAASGTYAGSGGWRLIDNMRSGARVYANNTDAETGSIHDNDATTFEADGFSFNDNQSEINRSSHTYIYMAIRRGPLAVPTDATEVFAIDQGDGSTTEPAVVSGFPVDMAIRNWITGNNHDIASRLTAGRMYTNIMNAEDIYSSFDYSDGFQFSETATTAQYHYMWKRAPGFFDVVAVTGASGAMTINHNLGVAPEFILGKKRNGTSHWFADQVNNYLRLNTSDANLGSPVFNNLTSTTFQTDSGTFGSGENWIVYLFASCPGVSKVGSYAGNGTSQTIDCGFTSGARFVLIKRTDATGDWYVWDSERGIVAGNDPFLKLNTADVEVTNTDWIDPDNSGFIVNSTITNASSANYIFYAIA